MVHNCLEKYFGWSGHEANVEKSSILFSKSTSIADWLAIKGIFGFKEMPKDSLYLGNSLLMCKSKTKDFKVLRDRVNQRLERWSRNLLSKAGKATLISSVIQAILVYTMSTFRIPSGICNDLDALVRKFWWGQKLRAKGFFALKSWKDICSPKNSGGLGFRLFKDLNSALLAKLRWKVAVRDESHWCRILRAKYMKGKSFFEIGKAKRASLGWQGILSTRHILLRRACFKVGNGLKVNIWRDPWLMEVQGMIPSAKEGIDLGRLNNVIDLCRVDGAGWDTNLIRNTFK